MVDRDQTRRTLDELESLHKTLSAIVKVGGPNWRWELVQCRRELARTLGQLAGCLHRDEISGVLTAIETDGVRERSTAFRSALALHQARFPAVSIIDGKDPEYQASAAIVRSTAAELFTFARPFFGLS